MARHDDEAVGNGPAADRQEQLRRRIGDRKLRDALAAEDFTGRRYRRFEEELAAYGLAVLRGWLHSGYIFQLTAARGFPLKPTGQELAELHRNSDLREELANMTVALTLPRFRRQALVDGGWRSDSGASLPTYFMGATLYVFPNQFREYRAYQNRYTRAAHAEGVLLQPYGSPLNDPAAIALGGLRVQEELRGLDERTAAVVALNLAGYHQEEIAELLSMPSPRTVEGILYRWRTRARQRTGTGGDGDAGE
ncbi:hypothetical protein [Actinoplanes aureus]|uniref:Uncharacterized protein n=1 Tax=Actinoplanes aureus TaxID=2792083 RepID=A0A931G1T6_9ACTN|nr:hypothetical protein [Actinoplanes aureus]MBG0565501.1 hypothetical protein [Actinoplanes aureus]